MQNRKPCMILHEYLQHQTTEVCHAVHPQLTHDRTHKPEALKPCYASQRVWGFTGFRALGSWCLGFTDGSGESSMQNNTKAL